MKKAEVYENTLGFVTTTLLTSAKYFTNRVYNQVPGKTEMNLLCQYKQISFIAMRSWP